MGVAAQRERGRVMAERAAELEQVGPLAQVDRGEGVPERVEASPGRVHLLDDRLQAARHTRASLQKTDLGAVKRAAESEGFLGYAGFLAKVAQVLAEAPGDLHHAISNRVGTMRPLMADTSSLR